jgi:hypothetical protein
MLCSPTFAATLIKCGFCVWQLQFFPTRFVGFCERINLAKAAECHQIHAQAAAVIMGIEPGLLFILKYN